VGKDLFSGAVNWKNGVLFSKEASQLKTDQRCPNCGAKLELVGKGLVICPYCGTEVFLHKD
jgi:DNA-directed RNA polymerase subunit RPC12/RpoP